MKTSEVESEIEAKFLELVSPFIVTGLALEPQVDLLAGKFRGDFILRWQDRVVLFECDGRKFHDYSADKRRDKLILDGSDVTDIFRLRGSDLFFDGAGCIRWTRACFPFMFNVDARSLDFDSLLLTAATMVADTVQPIWRVLVPYLPAGGKMELISPPPGCSILGRVISKNSIALQLHSPYWSWQFKGQQSWELGDVFGLDMDAIKRAPEVTEADP